MLCGIDLGCFFDRAMVKPQDDVVIIVELRTGDGDRLVRVVGKDGKGAGGIESKAANRVGINAVLIQDPLD